MLLFSGIMALFRNLDGRIGLLRISLDLSSGRAKGVARRMTGTTFTVANSLQSDVAAPCSPHSLQAPLFRWAKGLCAASSGRAEGVSSGRAEGVARRTASLESSPLPRPQTGCRRVKQPAVAPSPAI